MSELFAAARVLILGKRGAAPPPFVPPPPMTHEWAWNSDDEIGADDTNDWAYRRDM